MMQQPHSSATPDSEVLASLWEMQDVWGITGISATDLCPQVIGSQLQEQSMAAHTSWRDKAHLRAASHWLSQDLVDVAIPAKVEGYLDVHYHLCQQRLWSVCQYLLWVRVGQHPLHRQLQVWGWYTQALDLLTPLLSEVKDCHWQCFLHHQLGHIYAILGDPDRAIQSFEMQITLAEKLNLPRALMRGLGELGWVYGYCQSNAEAALDHYQRQLQLARHMHERCEEAKALDGLGRVYYLQGHWRQSSKYHQRAWAVVQTTDALLEDKLTILLRLEGSYLDWSRPDRSLILFQEKLKLAQMLGDKYQIWYTTHNLGCIYINIKQWEKAEATMQQAIALAKEMQVPQRLGLSLATLGACYARRRDWQRAISHTKQACLSFQQVGNQISEAHALFNLSYCYSEMEQSAQALRYAVYLRRLVCCMGNPSYLRGMLLLAVANAHWHNRKHIAALWLSLLGLCYLGWWRSADGRLALIKIMSVLNIRNSKKIY